MSFIRTSVCLRLAVVACVWLLAIIGSDSFIFHDRRTNEDLTEDEEKMRRMSGALGEEAEETQILMRELEEMQKRHQETQFNDMLLSLMRKALPSDSLAGKKSHVYSSYEDAADRADYALSSKFIRKSFDEAALPPFPHN